MTAPIDINDLVLRLKTALPPISGTLSLHEPLFQGNEWKYVKDCLDTGWVSSVGEYVTRFELLLAEYTGVDHAIAVVNGTAALHICLQLSGVGSNDEVIIPSLTFIATANAVMYCGAVPLFAESEEGNLGMDAEKLEIFLSGNAEIRGDSCFNRHTGRRIAALMPMHTFGHPVDIDALMDLARRWKLPLIEDAAESLGSFYKGRHTGGFGKIAGLSFNGNKIVTTGGGGAILTNDPQLAILAKHLTTTAKIPHKWTFSHDMIGYNYRLPNINAALGCAQMESLAAYVLRKRRVADNYRIALEGFKGLRFVCEPVDTSSNYWLNTILLDMENAEQRDNILECLNQAGLTARPAWSLLHKLPMFAQCPRMALPVAESLERRIVNIPSSVFLGEK